MIWQIFSNGEPTGENFDDGIVAAPGDEAFTTDLVIQHVGANGSFSFIGTSHVES